MDIQFNRVCGRTYATAKVKIRGKIEYYIASAIDKIDAFEKIWQLYTEDLKAS
jgi:hypothetical protein